MNFGPESPQTPRIAPCPPTFPPPTACRSSPPSFRPRHRRRPRRRRFSSPPSGNAASTSAACADMRSSGELSFVYLIDIGPAPSRRSAVQGGHRRPAASTPPPSRAACCAGWKNKERLNWSSSTAFPGWNRSAGLRPGNAREFMSGGVPVLAIVQPRHLDRLARVAPAAASEPPAGNRRARRTVRQPAGLTPEPTFALDVVSL